MGRSGESSLFINILLAFTICGDGLLIAVVTFDSKIANARGGMFTTTALRLLNYALAVTTAVKNATVMIRINIVTALIACVVISSPYCLALAFRSKLADRSAHRGKSGLESRSTAPPFFSILIRG